MVTGSQQKVESIFSGNFGGTKTTQVLMWSVLRDKKINFGVLRICCPELNIDGEISILWGLFAVGARMKNGVSGYPALRALLCAPAGSYDYSEVEESAFDDNFKIRLTDLISLWPNLPETLEEVMAKRNSLNRIRSVTAENIEHTEEAVIDQNVLSHLQKWERNSLHLRAAAFWGTFVVFSSIAAVAYCFK